MPALKRRPFLLLLLLGCAPSDPRDASVDDHCIVRRAAFDIGSATTKVKVADVDRCQRLPLAVIFADEEAVFYRDDVERPHGDAHFQLATMRRGMTVLDGFLARARALDARQTSAVATSAFRLAANGDVFARQIRSDLGLEVRIVSQSEEARLGFIGAVRTAGLDPKRTVVWDIGGRSMQMAMLGDDGHLDLYRGSFASGQMRDFVSTELQGKHDEGSPNPVHRDEARAAVAHAESLAKSEVPANIKRKLAESDTVVLGIGALKYYGDRPAHEAGATCARKHLEVSVDDLLTKSDAEIGGAYASTQVSDRLLIVGFMRGLAIQRIELAEVDLTDGVLLEADYWP